MAEEDPEAILSDVEEDDDPAPIVLSTAKNFSGEDAALSQRLRDLQSELDRERQARKVAEDGHADLQNKFARLKVLAQEAIRKRDEALREKDEAARIREEVGKQLEEARRQKEVSRSEAESAAQMLVTGIEKISGKAGSFVSFDSNGLPKSQKYATGLASVAYGVIKRSSEIVDELVKQVDLAVKERNQAREQVDSAVKERNQAREHVDSAVKERNQAREQVEQRNFEIAIEVSQLEATIAAVREELGQKISEIGDKDGKISELEEQVTHLRVSGEESEAKISEIQQKLDSQKAVIINLMKNISLAHDQISRIIENLDSNDWSSSDLSESQFIWKETEIENLQTSIYELTKIASDKVRTVLQAKTEEIEELNQKVSQLLEDKTHIGNLLRNAVSSKMRKIAENGDITIADPEEDDVHRLAGVLEETVKASQLEIIGLQHQVEALRAECSLLKGQLSSLTKEIAVLKHRIKELEERERVANESIEGLMLDIGAAEEEIARWKLAAEQEAAAGRAIEQDFESQISSIRHELEDSKQAVSELETKLKLKEETSAAAIAARDAAEKSLKLADMRSARLRERMEELTQQLTESEISESMSGQRHRYFCWPWSWLGLTMVQPPGATRVSSNEMELSEPLM